MYYRAFETPLGRGFVSGGNLNQLHICRAAADWRQLCGDEINGRIVLPPPKTATRQVKLTGKGFLQRLIVAP